MDSGTPIFMQIKQHIENDILSEAMPEESQVPSTNDLAAFFRINPATALKGVSELVDEGILYKRRGIGMFVATGARDRLLAARRERFRTEYIRPLLDEAAALGINPVQLSDLIGKELEQ